MNQTSADQRDPIRVCFYVFFPGGGIGRYTHTLLEQMASMPELDVSAVCSPDYQWLDEDGYNCWAGLATLSHPIPVLRRLKFLRGQIVNPRRCIEHAVESGADIIHFSNINHLSFPLWRPALEESGIKVAVTAHDVKRQKAIISRKWEDAQLKAFYRFADAIFVHSVYQARELVEFAGISRGKIYVVPHGLYPHGKSDVDPAKERRRLEIPEDRQLALFFGQIRDEKNLDAFIRALALSEARPHLLVAGKGGGRHKSIEHYRSLARDVGVEDRVTFIDRYIEDEEAARLFRICDWVALPYENTFTSQSGVLNVAAEYDRPVLVSSAPVLSETVRSCDIGIACAGDTSAALAEGIDQLCQRIENGHRHLFHEYHERFSWKENARRTVQVYRALVS